MFATARRLRERWLEILIVGLAEAGLSIAATAVIRGAVTEGWFRDLAIVAFWFSALGIGALYLMSNQWESAPTDRSSVRLKFFTLPGRRKTKESSSEASAIAELAAEQLARSLAEADQTELQAELDRQRPFTEWAQALVDRERESPFRFLRYQARLANAAHLEDANPYFDLVITVTYQGVLRIRVGDQADGRLIWGGEAFAERPDFSGYSGGALPLTFEGPGGGALRLRQYVRDKVASSLRERFVPGAEIEFTHQLNVSLRIETFDGEALFDDAFPFGDYITIRLPR